MSGSVLLFVVLAALAIASGIMTITRRNPVSAAMYLVMHFFALAGLYVTLYAQLLAALQILVYAGAIMVLVLFVIMLLNLQDEDRLTEKVNPRGIIGTAVGGIFILQVVLAFLSKPSTKMLSDTSLEVGTIEGLGKALFTEYLFPFEAVSLLLLSAMVGAIIIAKKKIKS